MKIKWQQQKALAAKLEITPQHLNAVLNKRTQASAKLARAIANELGSRWAAYLRPDLFDRRVSSRRTNPDRRIKQRRKGEAA